MLQCFGDVRAIWISDWYREVVVTCDCHAGLPETPSQRRRREPASEAPHSDTSVFIEHYRQRSPIDEGEPLTDFRKPRCWSLWQRARWIASGYDPFGSMTNPCGQITSSAKPSGSSATLDGNDINASPWPVYVSHPPAFPTEQQHRILAARHLKACWLNCSQPP